MKSNLPEITWTEAVFSLLRALLGEISNNIRGISIELNDELLKVWMYTFREASGLEIEDFDADVMTQVFADFPDHVITKQIKIEFEFVTASAEQKIKPAGKWIFLRKENEL